MKVVELPDNVFKNCESDEHSTEPSIPFADVEVDGAIALCYDCLALLFKEDEAASTAHT